MKLRYAVGLPNVGIFGDIRTITEFAVSAERNGWDGVYLWDHVLYHEPDWPVASSVVAAAAIAAQTTRLRIIMAVALPRRQVQDVARDTAAIDSLSGRRLTVVAILGSIDREFSEFGMDPGLRARGRALDERLAQLTALWTQWRVPRVPIWCGARWPHTAGLRRAARYDGAMPTFDDQRAGNVPPGELAAAVSVVRQHRLMTGVPDIAVEGATAAPTAAQQVAPYLATGFTWWIEALGWWRGGLDAAAARIADGPPELPAELEGRTL